jgi:hypothetical protein
LQQQISIWEEAIPCSLFKKSFSSYLEHFHRWELSWSVTVSCSLIYLGNQSVREQDCPAGWGVVIVENENVITEFSGSVVIDPRSSDSLGAEIGENCDPLATL